MAAIPQKMEIATMEVWQSGLLCRTVNPKGPGLTASPAGSNPVISAIWPRFGGANSTESKATTVNHCNQYKIHETKKKNRLDFNGLANLNLR